MGNAWGHPRGDRRKPGFLAPVSCVDGAGVSQNNDSSYYLQNGPRNSDCIAHLYSVGSAPEM